MNVLSVIIIVGGIIKELLHVAVLIFRTRLEKDQALRKTKGEMLDAAKKAIDSGDIDHILNLADRLRQPGG